MSNAPIGIFDSGVGGLTVARAILDQLPNESTLYIGDTARGPYGPRPLAEVREFSLELMDFLVEQGVKAIVIACNTASAAMLRDARERYSIPVIEVIQPAVRRAVAASRTGRIGVIGTKATIDCAELLAVAGVRVECVSRDFVDAEAARADFANVGVNIPSVHGCHHAIAAIATGTATAVVLESIASAKRTNDAPHQPARALNGRVSCRNRTQARSDARLNAMERTFFRSVTHATVSTCTGCTAKSAAASSAPGRRSATKSRHKSTVDARCSSKFTRW